MTPVPKLTKEDVLFKDRIAKVLLNLRETSGETREQAAERIGVPPDTLGKWERAQYAPKGYNLGRLYRGYVEWGAKWEWFFDPPEVVVIDPVRSHLDALEASGAIAAHEREAKAAARRRPAAAKQGAARGTSSKRTPPRSPR